MSRSLVNTHNETAMRINIEINTCRKKVENNIFYLAEYLKIPKPRMRWAGHVARMGEERGVYRVLVGKPEGRRPLGRPRRR